jgi:hypothetical protein
MAKPCPRLAQTHGRGGADAPNAPSYRGHADIDHQHAEGRQTSKLVSVVACVNINAAAGRTRAVTPAPATMKGINERSLE